MAGANDAFKGPVDLVEIQDLWQTICKENSIVVTLATPTASDIFNSRIAQINAVVREECADRPVIDLTPALADRHGRIKTGFTVDGVHLSDAAISVWRSALAKHGI